MSITEHAENIRLRMLDATRMALGVSINSSKPLSEHAREIVERLAQAERERDAAVARLAVLIRAADERLCDCKNTRPAGMVCSWCSETRDERVDRAARDLPGEIRRAVVAECMAAIVNMSEWTDTSKVPPAQHWLFDVCVEAVERVGAK